MYTIQSYLNGRYISSLFSDSHEDTFAGRSLEDAYTWQDIEAARKIVTETGSCMLVKLPSIS